MDLPTTMRWHRKRYEIGRCAWSAILAERLLWRSGKSKIRASMIPPRTYALQRLVVAFRADAKPPQTYGSDG